MDIFVNKSHQEKIAVIVIHEIYGVNGHMKSVCHSLQEYEFDVFCPNLLSQERAFDYSQEGLAYQNFRDNVGFLNAVAQIKKLISDIKHDYQKLFIVGFSVGATVAWLCSELSEIHGIVGYYGSRIRDYTELTPKCPTLLIFPEEERAFNVDELISALNNKKINILKFNGQHGFSDPFSSSYKKESAQMAFNETVSFLIEA